VVIGGIEWLGGRNFIKRYNEHKRAFQNNSHSFRFVQHLNDHIHSFGSIDNIMQILHHQKKGPHFKYIRTVLHPQRSCFW